MSRFRALAVVLLISGVALSTSSCVVVAISHFYDESALTFDERLLGVWHDADDKVTVTVEPGEWRSYRLSYDHPTEKGTLTGFLFKSQGRLFLDLMPVRGVDAGSFTLPAHALAKISIGDVLTVSPLRFDWFDAAMPASGLPVALGAARGERSQIVLSATSGTLGKWLAARPAIDPAFGPEAVFRKN